MEFLFKKNIPMVYWIGLAIVILFMNFNTGPYVDFPVVFFIPVVLASWYNGRVVGIGLAIAMPLTRLLFSIYLWEIPWTIELSFVNATIRIFVLSLFAVLVDALRRLYERVIVLEGLLPMCHNCKKIKNASDQWQSLDVYLNENAGTVFLQGLCADCRRNVAKNVY